MLLIVRVSFNAVNCLERLERLRHTTFNIAFVFLPQANKEQQELYN